MLADSMASTSTLRPEDVPLTPSPPKQADKLKRNQKAKTRRDGAEEDDELNWTWATLADGSISKSRPLFSADGQYFFSVIGWSIRIYSTATGQVVSTLTNPPSRSQDGKYAAHVITSLTLNPSNLFQLLVSSLDGYIRVWDFLDGVLLQTIDVSHPVAHVCAHASAKDSVYVAVARPTKKKSSKGKDIEDNGAVLHVSLRPSSETASLPIQKPAFIVGIGKTRSCNGLDVSPDGAWLVAIAGNKVYVAKTSALKAGFTKYVSPERLSSLTFHPENEYFATGDDKGVVRLWYCLNDQVPEKAVGVEKKAQTTALHWHSHAVSSLSFTANGAYLLSGGEESVLVIWQLHTGKKEFVPRLGSPITSVSVSPQTGAEEYLVGLADATFTFINATNLRVSRSYARIRLDPTTGRTSRQNSVPLAVHKISGTLVLPSSHPSSLQIFDPATAKLISEVEVSPSNRVSRRDDEPLEVSRLQVVDVSPCNQWMATVDSRPGDEQSRPEIYLKLWWWDRALTRWMLNTRIDRPHSSRRVVALAFRPISDTDDSFQLASAGEDNTVKTWRLKQSPSSDGSPGHWIGRNSLTFRSSSPLHVSWSPDGSLLAAAYGATVALYDLNGRLLAPLTSPEHPCTSAHFVGASGQYLAVVGRHSVCLWDLVSQSISWQHTLPQPISQAITHPTENLFALFSSDSPFASKISLFRTYSSVPYAVHAVPFTLQALHLYPLPSVARSAAQKSAFSLVGITDSWSLILMGDDPHVGLLNVAEPQEIISDSVARRGRTIFEDTFGSSAFTTNTGASSDQISSRHGDQTIKREKVASSILDAPAYLLPGMDSLFDTLMSGFLKERKDDVPEVKATSVSVAEQTGDEDSDCIPLATTQVVDVTGVEIESLTQLFRASILKPPEIVRPTLPPAKPTNGSSHHVTPSSRQKGLVSTSILQPNSSMEVSPSAPAALPQSNGHPQKRKRKAVSE